MASRRTERRCAPSRQRGAIGILSAVVLLLLFLCAALALDTGRLIVEKRQLQQRADLAATTAAQRYCDGFSSVADTRGEVLASLSANGFDPADSANTVSVMLGGVSTTDHHRQFADDGSDQAAAVQLTRTVPASLLAGGLIGKQATLQAGATAQRDLIGALSASAWVANLNDTDTALLNQVLGALLTAPLAITTPQYNGLEQADIPLLRLRDALAGAGYIGAEGSVQDVANTTLAMRNFLLVLAQALSADGNAGAATTLNDLYTAVQATAAGARSLLFSRILSVEGPYPDSQEALKARINVMALLTAGTLAINRSLTVTTNIAVGTSGSPLLQDLIGNTLNTQLVLHVIEPPTIAVGRFGFDADGQPRTLARTAQLEARLTLHLDLTPGSSDFAASLLNLVATIKGDIGVGVSIARGDAWLDHISRCPALQSRDFDFSIGARPEPAALSVGSADDTSQPADLQIGLVGGLATADVYLHADLPLAAAAEQLVDFNVDLAQSDSLPTPARGVGTDLSAALNSGLSSLGSSAVTNVTLHLLGLPLSIDTGDLAGDVAQILTPVLSQAVRLTLQPVLALLGIDIGELDVQLLGVEEGHGALLL